MSAAFDASAFFREAWAKYGPAPELASVYERATLSLEDAEQHTREAVARFYEPALDWVIRHADLNRRKNAAKKRFKQLAEDDELDPANGWQRTAERACLDAVLRETIEAPLQHGLKVGLGIGKTYQAILGAIAYVEAAKSARVRGSLLWTAPTLAMADQTAEDFRAEGAAAGVYRGRRAPDPNAEIPPKDDDDDTGRMCLDLPAVRLAHDADLPVSTHVCGSGKSGEPSCRFRDECPFQSNLTALRQADVIVASHAALFHTLGSKLDRKIRLTVIDEAFWQGGLMTSTTPLKLLEDGFDTFPVLDKEGRPRSFATRRLAATMHEVVRVLGELVDGSPLGRDLGVLDAKRCREAAGEQFHRIVHAEMRPGMPLDERKAAAKRGARNRQFRGMAALLHALADHLDSDEAHCGRVETETANLKAGTERRVLVHGRKDFVKHSLAHPVLHLDATMPTEAVRPYLSRFMVPDEVQAVTPHMRVVQILSTRDNRGGFGKTSLIPTPDLEEGEADADRRQSRAAEKRRRGGRLAEMRDYFARMVQHHGPGLIVTYMAARPYFADMPGVALGHFNAVSGLNTHRNVGWVAVLGRPMPRPEDTALTVKQLFGRWVEAKQPDEEPAGLLMADGSARSIRTRRYADADLEAVRNAITDANVVQAIGRPRGVRRTAADPVLVLLMSDVVAPFPVHQVANWPDEAPDVVQRMAARGVVLAGPKDAAAAYPDLFSSEEAAKKAILRSRPFGGHSPMISILKGECPPNQFTLIRYRPTGRGQQTRTAHVIADRLDTVREWLEGLLGPLALFEVTATEAPAASPTRQPAISPAAAEPAPCPEPPAMPKPSPPFAAISLPFHYLAARRLAPVGDVWTVRQRDGTMRDVRPAGTIELPPLVFSTGPDGRRLASRTILFGVQGDAELSCPHPSGQIPDVVIEMRRQPSAGEPA